MMKSSLLADFSYHDNLQDMKWVIDDDACCTAHTVRSSA